MQLNLIEYLLKLSLSLALVHILYHFLFRRLTFHKWNRWYLLAYSLGSFLIPFININPWLEQQGAEDGNLIGLVPVWDTRFLYNNSPLPGSTGGFFSEKWILPVLIVGSLFMAIRFVIQYISLRRLIKNAKLILDENIRIYQVDAPIQPFSFGKSIFINSRSHEEKELKEIIRHEFVHVRQKHTLDILWGEWLCLLNWYNPFAWLIRAAIRQNLEFIADHQVLENGIDRRQYQYLLLKVTGGSPYRIATNFNFSSLKTRIAMMNKMRSARLHLLKFLFILPVLVVTLLAFRNREHTLSGSGLISESFKKDTVPAPPPPPPVPNPPAMPEGVVSIDVEPGKAVVQLKNGTTETYDLNNPEEKKSFESKYGMIKPPPPPPPPMAPPPPKMPPGVATINVNNQKATVRMKNGKVETYDLSKPEEKEKFELRYGKLPPLSPPPAAPQGIQAPENVSLPGKIDPLVIIDGIKQPQGTDLNKINPSEIESVNILKNNEAYEAYGEFGKNGVVIIRTKSHKTPQNGYKPGIGNLENFQGLILVDGKEYNKSAFRALGLKQENIASMNVLKGEPATKKFGEKGKNGVIEIITRQNSDASKEKG